MFGEQLIEGVGNEVTITFSIIVGGIVLILVWMSTRVSERSYNHYFHNQRTNTPAPEPQNVQEDGGEMFQSAADLIAGTVDMPDSDAASEVEENANRSSSQAATSRSEPSVESDRSHENISDAEMSTPAHIRGDDPRYQGITSELLPDHFYIRLKFLDESSRIIQIKPSDKVGEIRRKYFPVSTASRYRMIFRGQVLRSDAYTMEQYNVQRCTGSQETSSDMPVVHCFLSSEEQQQSNRSAGGAAQEMNQTTDELNIGHFFLPLLGSILVFLWYLCIFHTALFNPSSMFGIVGLTCFFIVMVVNQTSS